MLPRKFMTDERAISNLIATLILIAVAVVGGAFAYTAFRNQASSTTTSADLQVQDLTVQKVGSEYASVTLKNVGTQRLSSIEVVINPGGDATSGNGTITLDSVDTDDDDGIDAMDPGVTDSGSQTGCDGGAGSLTAGETYAVRITASTPDGSITKTMTVRVKS